MWTKINLSEAITGHFESKINYFEAKLEPLKTLLTVLNWAMTWEFVPFAPELEEPIRNQQTIG